MHEVLTKLFSFPNAPTEIATQLTTRVQNILQSPSIARYDVTYKLYRRQSDKIATLQFSNSPVLYCFSGSAVYELGSEFENVLLKLKTWTLRQTMKIMGSVHEISATDLGTLGMRRVSVGVISQGPSAKGLVLDLQEAHEDGSQAATALDQSALHSLMGPIYRTLLVDSQIASTMMLFTGGGLVTNQPARSGKLQTAASYFELFSNM